MTQNIDLFHYILIVLDVPVVDRRHVVNCLQQFVHQSFDHADRLEAFLHFDSVLLAYFKRGHNSIHHLRLRINWSMELCINLRKFEKYMALKDIFDLNSD